MTTVTKRKKLKITVYKKVVALATRILVLCKNKKYFQKHLTNTKK